MTLDQDQYWLGHLKAIDASGTTTKSYGKLHGLNVQKLYEWRKKFKTRQAPESLEGSQGWVEENPFVAVQVKTASSVVAIAPAEVPERLLAGYKGYLMTDGYPGYNQVGSDKYITHLACWAHARRGFGGQTSHPGQSEQGR